ncbi:2-methylcitrate dehydratase [Bacillus sp. 03113]|uniref:2-methylcitrate dehydratase n=1 Tax=Bacillus sp. 03113 TaxID=2578211 RepID=UPI0011416B7A|nr:2-methylcitrate dehydratase [Bacillus sp. 03113]
MSFIDFKALIKKVNLKPKGVKEIVIEVSGAGLDGKLDKLSGMIDQHAEVSLESLIINYNVTINSKTNKPLKEYKVNQSGVVEEVKNVNEQMEADLGLPEDKPQTKEEKKEAEREVIDQFILEGLAPNFDDFPYYFADIVKRRLEGESFIRLANELCISSGKVADLIDEFRIKCAPLAQAWWEWKLSNPSADTEENTESEDSETEGTENDTDELENDQETDNSDQDEKDSDSEDGAA